PTRARRGRGRRGLRRRVFGRRRAAFLRADHGNPRLRAAHRHRHEPGAADHRRRVRFAREPAPRHDRSRDRGDRHGIRARRRARRGAPRPCGEPGGLAAPGGRPLRPYRRAAVDALAVSARDEHLAPRQAAGLFDFSFMGLYEFHGTAELVPRQSRRLTDIEPGRIAYTLLLNEDGSVFNDATVWNMGDDRWWLFT